ncbi:MAG: DNRLRE domain-containing protein, partial [Actinobacteria bacterium]|nr:DNRLRE domain-containing protein [Actinomycetota bacterium]
MADWRLSRLLIAGIVTMGVAAVPAVARADSGSSPSTSSQTTPADASSAPDEATASAIAAAYGHQVEVSSLDDASSTTFMEPNGLTMEELSTTPVRVQQPDGSWKTTDLTLQQNADGSISPAVSPVDVTLGGAGSHTVATLNVGSGSVSYGWSGQLPAPTLSGSTATYADVAPGVNLVANVTTSGVETSVVFESAEAASARAVDLAVTASGLTATKDSSGVVSYADSSGSVVAQTPTPQAWDSELGGDLVGPGAGPVAGVPSALTTAAGNVLSATPARGAVTSATGVMTDQLQVPTSLLNDPSTTYPLVLDPGVICDDCSTGAHGYVENDGYNEINSSFDNGYVHVGTFDGGTTITRGLYTFTQGEIHGQNIISANLNLMDEYSYSCTREPVTVYYSAAISSGSNWSNATIGSQSDGATGGAFADGYDSACPAGPVGFPVTNIVAAFAASSSADMYFQLRTNEADDFYWKKFSGTASLDVYWASTPTWPAGRSVTPCWAQCSGWIDTYSTQPDLTGAATTGDKEHLDYTFEVYNSNSSWGVGSLADSLSVDDVADGALASTGQGSGGAWGTHALASGVHYYVYRVRACDQSVPSICGAWSSDANGWVEFEVDTGSPAVPAASVGGVSGSNPAPTVDFDT